MYPSRDSTAARNSVKDRSQGDLVIGTPSLVDVAILSPPLGLEHQAQMKALYP